jgi:hypothetical protein
MVRSLGVLAGFCYTQFADTYQEANGLLYSDRTPKFPLEAIAAATCGDPRIVDQPIGPSALEPEANGSGSPQQGSAEAAGALQ